MRLQKGIMVFTVVLLSGAFLFAGCAAQQAKPAVQQPAAPAQCIPEWQVNPPSAEDGVYGTGIAKMKDQALSKKASDSRARDEVAQSIQVKVQTMMKDFLQQAGIGEEAQALQFSQSVSKQISSQVLYGCKIVKRKICPDGTWHSLALWPINQAAELKNEIATKAKDQIKNEYALYNEFKAKNGFEELQKELDKLDFTEE